MLTDDSDHYSFSPIIYTNDVELQPSTTKMKRLRTERHLELCYTAIYTLPENDTKVIFQNATSFHDHWPEVVADPNYLAADVIGIACLKMKIVPITILPNTSCSDVTSLYTFPTVNHLMALTYTFGTI